MTSKELTKELKRESLTVKIDPRITEELKRIAEKKGTSISRFLEKYFIDQLQTMGNLPDDFESLGELRGRKV